MPLKRRADPLPEKGSYSFSSSTMLNPREQTVERGNLEPTKPCTDPALWRFVKGVEVLGTAEGGKELAHCKTPTRHPTDHADSSGRSAYKFRECRSTMDLLRFVNRISVSLAILATSLNTALFAAQPPAPKIQAHSHNDYLQKNPLLDALDQGFCSVEADVFLVDGQLLVGHDKSQLRSERTLQSLYLNPLHDRIRKNGGAVYPKGPPFHLLIDIKQDAERVYETLDAILKNYRAILTRFEDDTTLTNALTITLSGDRPKSQMLAQPVRWAAFDGRIADLEGNLSPHFMALVSDSWFNHFQWRGLGEFPKAERDKLRALAAKAHDQGRRLRFWGSPDNAQAWREFQEAGVDLINTDHLRDLADFLAQKR